MMRFRTSTISAEALARYRYTIRISYIGNCLRQVVIMLAAWRALAALLPKCGGSALRRGGPTWAVWRSSRRTRTSASYHLRDCDHLRTAAVIAERVSALRRKGTARHDIHADAVF